MGYNYKIICRECKALFHPTALVGHAKLRHQQEWTKELIKTFPRQCLACDQQLDGDKMAAHLRFVHNLPQFGNSDRPERQPASTNSPIVDSIHAAERQIHQAILSLEAERDQLHAKIVEIDNLVSKYKKFNGNS